MFQAKSEMQNLSPSRTTCASLLRELQSIWDEIGENDGERDKMLLQLEQECLDIYRRKVEKTRKCRADLHQQLADAKAEITSLVSALGELPSFSRERGTLKEQISSYERILEDLRSKKQERVEIFLEIQSQIVSIRAEIVGNGQPKSCPEPEVDERDLTVKRLGELKSHLQDLQNKKVLRLQKVNSYISSIQELAGVMSNDFMKTVNEIHPSLGDFSSGRSKSVSNDTIAQLTGVIHSLNQEKKQRLQKLQDLGGRLVELWNLMDTQNDERKRFDHVTSLMSSPIDEVSGPGCLALDVIDLAKTEVDRLNVLKVSKMKELVLKKQNELEEIYQQSHMDVDNDAARRILSNLIDSG